MLQSTALNILRSGQNVFLTGAAGAGKTYVLNQYIAQLRRHGLRVAVTASTGIAATHLGGQTLHSWSGMGIREHFEREDLDRIAKNKTVRERIEKTHVLIIDEISMISRKMLENLDKVLQYIRLSQKPFGGLQVVFCGDFFQLPPVSRVRLANVDKFAFMAPAWVRAQLQICYLSEQFRQNKDDLNDFLNEMRSGEISDSRQDSLREHLQESIEKHQEMFRNPENPPTSPPIRLFTHNADVDMINAKSLKALDQPAVEFVGVSKGESTLVKKLKSGILAQEKLILKNGAPVMFIKNNPESGYSNGTLGVVSGFDSAGLPIVTTRNGKKIVASPIEWKITDGFGAPVASFAQVPLRLAWAITVHKSQGMTLDEATVDLSKTFEPGQGYVALSRVRGWDGLLLLGCNHNAMQMDPLVLKADDRFKALSLEAAAKHKQVKNPQEVFEKRVLAAGGTINKAQMAENVKKQEAKVLKKKKTAGVTTYMLTKSLIDKQTPLNKIVEARGMSEDTILKHLWHLKTENPKLDLKYLQPKEKDLAQIAQGFATARATAKPKDRLANGNIKLRFVFDILQEKYNFRELKLAQLFLEDFEN